jgi:prepilin-type processing-associated H-X9-DG protein
MRNPNHVSAFSVVELLAVLGIIAVVIGLTLPAVQSAREAARRAKCQSNLHQIGLAIHNYHQVFECFPIGYAFRYFDRSYSYSGFYSMHARLLPYLDERPIYDAINFTLSTSPRPVDSYQEVGNAANLTAISAGISIFLCPSDAGPFQSTGVNYRGNVGVGPMNNTSIEFPDSNNGLFPELGFVRAAYVPDGLSHTAAFAERLRGSDQAYAPVPERDFWQSTGFVGTADDQLKACRIAARPGASGTFGAAGDHWLWSGRERTLYSHTQVPNGKVPDCLDLHVLTGVGMATARSWHPGGVNVLMGDGACRPIDSSIDQAIWRAFGTRNGGELVD